MARNAFTNGASLFRVIENSPIEHLKGFFLQADANFRVLRAPVEAAFATETFEAEIRARLLSELNNLSADQMEPVEAECQRVLSLSEAKGPTSLETIVYRQLSNEECAEFDDQPGNLAKSLWAHVRQRREFDNAVSFKDIRSWRNAGSLFAAFNVDLDGKAAMFGTDKIDTDKLATAIGKKLKSNKPLSIGLIDLPEVKGYFPSVLVIVRFAGQQASVATHGEKGERRLIYFLPQDEAILIYTPADERIEVAATRASVRNAVAECFAADTLGQDISKKPLTSAAYELHRFLTSIDLPQLELAEFTLLSAKVVELELRVENWQSRLSLKAIGKVDMPTLVQRYFEPAHALRRALGVSRVLIAIQYETKADSQAKVLEIVISDRNSCSLNSERDPVVRNFGRKLLEGWGIIRAFRDLDAIEALDILPIMAELWELNEKTQPSGYFSERGIAPKRLEEAKLMKCKEVELQVTEPFEDPEVDGPTIADRTVYAVDLGWMQERLITALKSAVDRATALAHDPEFSQIGVMNIDDREVPCFLARGLGDMKTFIRIDERLRARSGAGPGIIFTGRSGGPPLIGANVVIPLIASAPDQPNIGADRDAILRAFRAGRSLALGAGTLELVKEDDTARLYVPGSEPLDLFGEVQIHAFDLLVQSARRGATGVKTSVLLAGRTGKSLENMMGSTRWPVIKTYIDSVGYGHWRLRLK